MFLNLPVQHKHDRFEVDSQISKKEKFLHGLLTALYLLSLGTVNNSLETRRAVIADLGRKIHGSRM